ncbi:MAG: Gfo/Idh/MocA family oxidoreductase [Alphaproteobacteria bacterium]|nr:Gfo/Idh/MocA family oxidoreductase [Alphaproteobacteria bacterium]
MVAPLRLGIAGLGFGAAVHLPVFCALPGVAVVALAARRAERARAVADRFAIPAACGGIEALLDRELDAVSLALPPAATERAAFLALERGIAVLAEKPLATTAAGARRLAERARGRTAGVVFQFGDAPAFAGLGAAIREGRAGAVRGATIVWLHEAHGHRHRRWSWKLDAAAQGGVMAMLGSHALFLIETMLGPIKDLQATLDRRATALLAPPGAAPAEDFVCLTATLASGAPLSLVLGNAAPGLSCHRWMVMCENGSLLLENSGDATASGFVLWLREPGAEPRLLVREEGDGVTEGDDRQAIFRRLAQRFAAAARAGAPCAPDFAAGARVQHLIEAVFAAAASGERLSV